MSRNFPPPWFVVELMSRPFPPPWYVVELFECYEVRDAKGQTLGWFYFRDHPQTARNAGVLERDEARRLAADFARLPELLKKPSA
jgi:hypothetical protein